MLKKWWKNGFCISGFWVVCIRVLMVILIIVGVVFFIMGVRDGSFLLLVICVGSVVLVDVDSRFIRIMVLIRLRGFFRMVCKVKFFCE